MVTAENRAMENFDRCFNQVLAFLQIDPLPVEVIWKFIEKLETCFDELSCPLVDINDESIVVKENLELKLNYVMEQFKVKLGKSSSNKKLHGLPRESVPVWGGEPYLFPPFWFSIKSRILSVDNMSDSEKLSRVLSALPESVRLIVFGLSLDELELVLKRKFLSFNTLSEFLVLKLSKVKVENNDDVLVLKEILVILESSQRLASSIVELNGQSDLLFKMNNTIFGSIFCLLPSELQKKFVDKFQLEDVSNLIQFVNDEVEKKIAHIRFLGNSSVLKQSKVKVVQDKQKESKSSSFVCYYCKEAGHLVKNCLVLKELKCFKCNEKCHIAKNCKVSDAIKSTSDIYDNEFLFDAMIDEKKVTCLLDTGAKSSILPESLFPVQPGTETKYFGTVNKQDVFATKGPITKTLVVNDRLELRFDTYVGNTSFPIIGRDFIKKYKVKWNAERMIGESLDKFTLGQADVDEHDGLSALFLVTADDLEDISLDEKQNDLSKEMKSLLDKWSCLSDGLGHTKVVKHRICVRPGTVPICKPERRFAIHLMNRARESVDEMISLGVIKPSSSEWCFQVVQIIKPDGTRLFAFLQQGLTSYW
ncbi:hypothetical protein BLOT_002855 [Blomia tropicalis]|nr:hypothetical protein BLOT_002855 [Blomia tropicalis]